MYCALVWVSLKIFSTVRLLWREAHSCGLLSAEEVAKGCVHLCLCPKCKKYWRKVKISGFMFQIITVYNLLWFSGLDLDIERCLSSVQSADRSSGLQPNFAKCITMLFSSSQDCPVMVRFTSGSAMH